jgi:PAS domain S-box-containing protein
MPADEAKTREQLIEELAQAREALRLAGVDEVTVHSGASLDQLREALAVSEQRYRNLFENSVLGIYRTTPDGQVLMANPALLRMLGYSSFAELSRRDLERGEFEPRYSRARFREKIEQEGEIIGLESMWIKRDGTALFVRENARVVRNSSGVQLYYEGTIEDISERKRAEEKLRALLSELSRVAERDRLRTAGRITDHAGEALRAARELLEPIALYEGAREALWHIERAARAALILRDEIDPPSLDDVTLESALETLVRRQASLTGMRFEFTDDGRPKPLEQDQANLLLAATRELLNNAIRHSRAGRCRVLLSRDEEQARVAVEDDGVGFDPRARQPRFGLELIRERLEAAGGTLEIASAPGRGTKIALRVPLAVI